MLGENNNFVKISLIVNHTNNSLHDAYNIHIEDTINEMQIISFEADDDVKVDLKDTQTESYISAKIAVLPGIYIIRYIQYEQHERIF